jgi:hypothetical protein
MVSDKFDQKGNRPDLIYDVRLFAEPVDDSFKCTGENFKVIACMAKHHYFARELGYIKDDIETLERDDSPGPPGRIEIVFVCRGGNHRGPAMARIVRHCLDQSGYLVGEPNHMSRWSWKKGKCTTCSACLDTAAKEEALWSAFKVWNVVGAQ